MNSNYRNLKFLLFFGLVILTGISSAQDSDTLTSKGELKKLSLEELMNINVTSISLRPEKLTEVASAVQVISSEDIHRSSATRLPEALRLATNLQVSQANSHDWAITSRGFNGLPAAGGVLANKLLVMIDGRSVYSPLYGGVYWDVQNVLLEDVDRIEVVSGPGGTMWGANAVNGVINIVSKNSKETQGLYVSGAGGTLLQDHAGVRYGFRLDSNLFCRVYGQRYDQKNTNLANGSSAWDAWNNTQGGFRMDYHKPKSLLTFQGDFYLGEQNGSTIRRVTTDGQNALIRYRYTFSEQSDITVKVTADRTWRLTPNSKIRSMYQVSTYDMGFRHRFALGKSQSILWGAGYVFQQDRISAGLNPLVRDMPVPSGFIQDEITFVPDLLKLTIGSKFLHNIFSGFEYQPCARIALLPGDHHTIWASVSRSVRTPSRFDSDLIVTPVKFDSEKVIAYELGYRVRPIDRLMLSFAGFYNEYTDLRSLDYYTNPSPSLIVANSQRAESWGGEFSGNCQITDWWRMRGGYTYFEKNISPVNNNVLPISSDFEGVDPQNQCTLQSIMDLPGGFNLDLTGRYVDVLPAIAGVLPVVPSYFAVDARIALQLTYFEFSIVGQNLLEDKHAETGYSKITRNFYGRITCRF